jgi:Bacterial SH3 domain
MEESITGARLCPSCANTIEETAVKCPYCRAEFSADSVPQWLNRNTPLSERPTDLQRTKKSSIPARFVWPATTLILVLAAFYAGAYMQHRQGALTAEAYSKQLQTKDQLMQSQETQMSRLRQELHDNTNQLADLKTKLDASQKASTAAQQRLAAANHEVERLNTTTSSTATRTGSRAPASSRSYPAPLPTARPAAAGVYETVRETSVYDNPSSQGRVMSQIRGGTRINVVSSGGNWLEVRSKHGNPPGYVRSDDARLVSRVN